MKRVSVRPLLFLLVMFPGAPGFSGEIWWPAKVQNGVSKGVERYYTIQENNAHCDTNTSLPVHAESECQDLILGFVGACGCTFSDTMNVNSEAWGGPRGCSVFWPHRPSESGSGPFQYNPSTNSQPKVDYGIVCRLLLKPSYAIACDPNGRKGNADAGSVLCAESSLVSHYILYSPLCVT